VKNYKKSKRNLKKKKTKKNNLINNQNFLQFIIQQYYYYYYRFNIIHTYIIHDINKFKNQLLTFPPTHFLRTVYETKNNVFGIGFIFFFFSLQFLSSLILSCIVCSVFVFVCVFVLCVLFFNKSMYNLD